ncbi:GNAT family N-acetyltransferase [Vagococcus silagei]|uniref:GNAT family N-acetyltransferase n=1 Tax=Vagococcus silagei TaxID=2508885 RepID=UPI001EF544C3|nr:GNAT family N-acetyltransferase [Vagococcus silagei]
MTYLVRTFNKSDEKEAIQLYIDIFTREPWNDTLSFEQIELFFNRIQAMNTFLGFVLIESETNKLIGVSLGFVRPWYQGLQYHLDSLYIANQYQGQGLGKEMLTQIEHELKAKDISAIILDTEREQPAEFFYQNNGFVSLDESVLYAKSF